MDVKEIKFESLRAARHNAHGVRIDQADVRYLMQFLQNEGNYVLIFKDAAESKIMAFAYDVPSPKNARKWGGYEAMCRDIVWNVDYAFAKANLRCDYTSFLIKKYEHTTNTTTK